MQPSAAAAVFRDLKFDLVLGGGGVKGLSHAGMLLSGWERGICFVDVYCVSIGSLVGAMYVNGESPQTLAATFMAELDRFGRHAFEAMVSLRGLWNIVRHGGAVDVKPFFDDMIARHNLRTQPNLKIIAAYWNKGVQPFLFDSGDYDLSTALNASCAMPPFVKPIWFTKDQKTVRLVDGGVWHDTPHHFCERPAVISRLGLAKKLPDHELGALDKVIHVGEMVVRPVKELFREGPDPSEHILIDTGLDQVATFTFNLSDEVCKAMVKRGYDQASRAFDDLERRYKCRGKL